MPEVYPRAAPWGADSVRIGDTKGIAIQPEGWVAIPFSGAAASCQCHCGSPGEDPWGLVREDLDVGRLQALRALLNLE